MEASGDDILIYNKDHYTRIDGLELDGNDNTSYAIIRIGNWETGAHLRDLNAK